MLKNELSAQKKIVIKLILVVSLITTSFSIIINYYNFFNFNLGLIMLISDLCLAIVLTISLIKFDRIIKSNLYKSLIFSLFPILYFPITWLSSYGFEGVGMHYYFLFAVAIIYMLPDKSGFFTTIIILLEIMLLILLEKKGLILTNSFINREDQINMTLIHYPVVAFGCSFIFYNSVKRTNILTSKLYDYSVKDYLTDTYNRRYLINFLEETQSNSKNRLLYVVFFDLNSFKKINDEYGHAVGDEVLKVFASVLKSVTRESDVCGRLGGDEFLLILQNLDYDDILNLLERVRKAFKDACNSRFMFEVSISAGIESGIDKSVEEIINYADLKMYKEKNS